MREELLLEAASKRVREEMVSEFNPQELANTVWVWISHRDSAVWPNHHKNSTRSTKCNHKKIRPNHGNECPALKNYNSALKNYNSALKNYNSALKNDNS